MQDQKLTELKFEAGVVTEETALAGANFWTYADKIRFRFGKAELMGGWQNVTTPAETTKLVGMPRILDNVRSLEGVRAAAIGTHVGLFSSNLSTFWDITPLVTAVAGTDILTTQAGSTQVIVSVSNHGLTSESLVGIVSAAVTIGGNIQLTPTTSVTVAYQVSVLSNNAFSIDAGVTAAETSAGAGGDIGVFVYYPAGRVSDTVTGGWGGGVWGGAFGWGTPTGANIVLPMRHWSTDQWGTELMAVPSGGPLMLWQPQNGISSRAVVVTAAPSVNSVVRIATEARHVLLYGTHDIAGDYDPLLVRWCSSEDYTDWTPTQTNTAGDFRLNSAGSEIVNVVKMRDIMLVFTDAELFLQSYIGPNDVFGFTRASRNSGLLARNAAAEYNGAVYWMGNNRQFFKYDGRAQSIPCTVLRYVFDGMDPRYLSKIWAGSNSQFGEIIWFYTSKDSLDGENDRYVIYNVPENNWTIGTMRRTAWLDRAVFNQILATGVVDPDAAGLFYQETGYAAGVSALQATLQSDFFDSDDGDPIMFCNKFVPDLQAVDGSILADPLNVSFLARKYPGGPTITKGPYAMTGSTQKISIRLRGREMALTFDSETSADAKAWRLGTLRMGLQADGKR